MSPGVWKEVTRRAHIHENMKKTHALDFLKDGCCRPSARVYLKTDVSILLYFHTCALGSAGRLSFSLSALNLDPIQDL